MNTDWTAPGARRRRWRLVLGSAFVVASCSSVGGVEGYSVEAIEGDWLVESVVVEGVPVSIPAEWWDEDQYDAVAQFSFAANDGRFRGHVMGRFLQGESYGFDGRWLRFDSEPFQELALPLDEPPDKKSMRLLLESLLRQEGVEVTDIAEDGSTMKWEKDGYCEIQLVKAGSRS